MTRNHTRIHPTVWLFWMSFDRVVGLHQTPDRHRLGLRPPTDSLQVRVIDTATVVFQTVREDSLETDELSTGLLGQVHLPGFSQVTAGLVTQLRLSATDINFGVNPVADSMFLQLRYTGDTYGQLASPTPFGPTFERFVVPGQRLPFQLHRGDHRGRMGGRWFRTLDV